MVIAALLHLGLYALLVWAIIAGRRNTAIFLAAVGLVASLVEIASIVILMGE